MRARSQESAFAWTSSAPPPSPPLHGAEVNRWKSKLACAKSRESAKTLQKTDAKCDTHRKKLRKIRCELESSCIQCSLPPKNRCENKTQIQFRVRNVPKTRVSAHASPEIAPPRAAADATTATSTEGTLWMIPGPVLCFSC